VSARPILHLLGPRSFELLPQYLHNADVGLIPFDVVGHAELVDTIHPLKLYEYLACGLPVVATRWRELEHLASPAILVDSPADFSASIRASLAQPPDRATAIAYAQTADWSGRLRALLDAVDLP
jgi:glycosyltransferase involved in cell wall biosynthesis